MLYDYSAVVNKKIVKKTSHRYTFLVTSGGFLAQITVLFVSNHLACLHSYIVALRESTAQFCHVDLSSAIVFNQQRQTKVLQRRMRLCMIRKRQIGGVA